MPGMTLVLLFLVVAVVGVIVAMMALADAMQANRRCDGIEQALRDAQLDYKGKTAAVRRKGWETRRRRAAELAARQLEFGQTRANDYSLQHKAGE
jgi:hypothetical protein